MPSLEDELDGLGQTVLTQHDKHDLGEAIAASHLQIVLIGRGTVATRALPDGQTLTIGRSTSCEISVDNESLSRRHAILTFGETTTIEDLGSANGTVVRGRKLEPGSPATISLGELVGLGHLNIILQPRSRPARGEKKMCTHEFYETRVEEECAREDRSGAPFAMLRIHTQRRLPDSFVEETLGELVRDSDLLGKYGPHEYEVLLPDTAPDKAERAIRRLERGLVERGLKCRIFAACCPRDGRSPFQLAAKLQAPVPERPSTVGTDIVVSDAQMLNLHRLVEQIADSTIGVLLLGETGVGKEVFARAVHRTSKRSGGPFVELNCAALTETLLESELFGHEKGAFTNATTTKPGLIESAHGGTLFLDEIGDMPLSTQVKLLRVIEDSQLRRVGALKARQIDVRFLAATNSDLESQIEAGRFRSDLFFRLNGVTILIPPLRERLSELEPLARAFIARFVGDDKPQPELSAEALELMAGYSWPGNIRELKHMMERAVLVCGSGPILVAHLPVDKMRANANAGTVTASHANAESAPASHASGTRPPANATVDLPPVRRGSEEEQQWILQALDRAGGNQTLAARILGISRRTLVNRLNEYESVHRPRKHK